MRTTRVTVQGSPCISSAAFNEANRAVFGGAGGRALPIDFDRAWQVTTGELRGTFPKRVEKWLYKHYRYKADKALIEHIGHITRPSVSKHGESYHFDFTNHIDWDDGDFGDNGSCFWGSLEKAREALQDDSGFAAMRFYDGPARFTGIGRCWTLRRSVRGRDCIVMFNAYGPINLQKMARILGDWMGYAHTPMCISNHGETSGLIYCNSGCGYLVHPPTVTAPESFDLDVAVPYEYKCEDCEEWIPTGNHYEANDYYYCGSCYSGRFTCCDRCSESVDRDDVYSVGDDYWCSYCTHNRAFTCDRCANRFPNSDSIIHGTRVYCEDCAERLPKRASGDQE